MFDPQAVAGIRAVGLKRFAEPARKTRIDVHREQFKIDGDALQTFSQHPHHHQAIGASGNGDQYAVAILQQVVSVGGFADSAI